MIKAIRVYLVIKQLSETNGGLTLKELSKIHNVSIRTVKRYISDIRSIKLPIIDIRKGANLESRFKIRQTNTQQRNKT